LVALDLERADAELRPLVDLDLDDEPVLARVDRGTDDARLDVARVRIALLDEAQIAKEDRHRIRAGLVELARRERVEAPGLRREALPQLAIAECRVAFEVDLAELELLLLVHD